MFSQGTVSANFYSYTGIDHLPEYQDDGHSMTHCIFKLGNQFEDQVIDERVNKKMYKNHYYQH